MLIDDIIYLVILLICVGFGEVFRGIKEPITKQWVSTCFGILVSYIVSGVHVIHPILCTIITAFLVVYLPQRIRHIAAFFFSFFYLLVIFRLSEWYGAPEPPGHTNLLQMILILRLSGLGFEVNAATKALQDDPDNKTYRAMKNISFMDAFHYGMGYIGLLTGPYYTYRTYLDCINKNFCDYVDIKERTIKKLKLIAISSLAHLFFSYYYPISYVYTDEFKERSLLYRFFYVYPSFFTFKTRIYTGMMLSESVCEMAGLGAYPTSCDPRPGHGPMDYKKATELAEKPEELVNQEIDFETVHNIDIAEVEASYKVRRAMKTWNITVQYWMAAYVYKQFPSKALRTAATFFVSAIWHGYAFGYYVTLLSLIFFLPVEDLYVKYYDRAPAGSLVKGCLWALLYFLRFSCMSYLGIGFQLLSFDNTVYYFTNIYAAGHVLVGLLFIIGKLGRPYFLNDQDKSDKKQ